MILAIQSKRLVVLEGPPGTGKTELAKLLCKILIPETNNSTRFTLASVDLNWRPYISIGGLKMIKNKIGPSIGKITEAIIKSIEINGNHWLILDEINRGDVSQYFSSLLTGMELDKGFLDLDFIYPDKDSKTVQLQIPNKFRIIGTMNSYDKDQLFSFSEALKRRTVFVEILPLSHRLLKNLVRMHSKKILFQLDIDKTDESSLKIIKKTENLILQVISNIRKIIFSETNRSIPRIYPGTSIILSIVDLSIRGIINNKKKNSKFSDQIMIHNIDISFKLIYCPLIKYLQPSIYQILLENIFIQKKFPLTYKLIRKLEKETKFY